MAVRSADKAAADYKKHVTSSRYTDGIETWANRFQENITPVLNAEASCKQEIANQTDPDERQRMFAECMIGKNNGRKGSS